MADAKKPVGKPAPKPSGGGESQIVFTLIVIIMIGFIVLPTVLRFFGAGTTDVGSGYTGILPEDTTQTISNTFDSFVNGITFLSIFISFLFILGAVYAKIRYSEVMELFNQSKRVENALTTRGGQAGVQMGGLGGEKNGQQEGVQDGVQHFQPEAPDPRWVEIERHMQSGSASDWRIAILEADIILYDMLEQMGYDGNSIGEKLKQVDPASFNTLDDAWRAHKIRNIIAHEGASYELSREEADRAIRLFKRVFEEFYFI